MGPTSQSQQVPFNTTSLTYLKGARTPIWPTSRSPSGISTSFSPNITYPTSTSALTSFMASGSFPAPLNLTNAAYSTISAYATTPAYLTSRANSTAPIPSSTFPLLSPDARSTIISSCWYEWCNELIGYNGSQAGAQIIFPTITARRRTSLATPPALQIYSPDSLSSACSDLSNYSIPTSCIPARIASTSQPTTIINSSYTIAPPIILNSTITVNPNNATLTPNSTALVSSTTAPVILNSTMTASPQTRPKRQTAGSLSPTPSRPPSSPTPQQYQASQTLPQPPTARPSSPIPPQPPSFLLPQL